jgi:hypothetical protein
MRKAVPASAYGRKDTQQGATKLVLTDSGVERRLPYRPGRLRTDVRTLLEGAAQASIEFALTALPVTMLLTHYEGKPATVCAQVCMQLADVFTMLGIESHATPVTVAVKEHGQTAYYGSETPTWEGTEFVGHCVLWIPALERFVDATVQQFDGIQQRLGPYTGPIGTVEGNGPLLVGQEMLAFMDGRAVSYTVVAGGDALVRNESILASIGEKRPRSAAYIAGQTVDALRVLNLAPRVPGHFERISQLLDAVGDAPVVQDETDAFRFNVDGRPLWIDELLPV